MSSRCGFVFPSREIDEQKALCFCCYRNIPLPLGGEVATKKKVTTVPIMVTTSLAGADPIKSK